jgi:hypothetical protein
VVFLAATTGEARAASLTVAWDPPTDTQTVGYIVWYGIGTSYSASADVGRSFQHVVTGLADGTNYCFRVQAYDADGVVSEPSDSVCASTAPAAAPAPTSPATGTPTVNAAGEIVLYAAKSKVLKGNWTATTNSSAAGGRSMRSVDRSWSSPNTALASPGDLFETRFDALANTPYTLWVRVRAAADSKWNDSIWVQFSDALIGGRPAYRIGTTGALAVNLETCAGCGTAGWGWQNTAYWLSQPTTVTFAESGTHTIRVQLREDGPEIDQIVLSPSMYRTSRPGPARNDATLLAEKVRAPIAATPYTGIPVAIPGVINAAYFDQGSAGLAYADASLGNAGGSFRSTDVDLEPSALGGHNIGWTSPGEWVVYTVNVAASGTYAATVRVASWGGGSLQIAAGAPSSAVKTVAVPNTGAWQSWVNVTVPITLSAGRQRITISFPTGNVNLRSVTIK